MWPGHPLEAEVRANLQALRRHCHDLQERVSEHNQRVGLEDQHAQIVTYLGQCILQRELNEVPDAST